MWLAVDQFCGRQWSALYTSRERTWTVRRDGADGAAAAARSAHCPVLREPVIGRSANRVTDQKKTTAGRSFRMVRHESIRATIYLLSSLTLVILPRLSLSCMNCTHIYTYTCAILRSLSLLLPLPFYHFPLSFSSFSPIICLCFFLSLSPLPSRRANLLLCLSQSYIAWSLFSFHSSLLIAKCRNILLPELFSSRSPNQLSRGGIARVVLCALSRGPCWSNWISRLARRSPPIPPIFSLCFCLSPPVLPLDTHLHQKFSYPNNIPIISFLRYVFERQILPNL